MDQGIGDGDGEGEGEGEEGVGVPGLGVCTVQYLYDVEGEVRGERKRGVLLG